MGNDITNQLFEKLPSGPNKIRISIPKLPLKGGEYTVTLFAEVNGEVADWIQEATILQVESGDFYNTGKLPESSQGNFYMEHSFERIA